MRHLCRGRKLSRKTSHRKAMLSNLAISVLDKERVVTTVAKAKEVRGVVERLITYGKKGDLNSIRIASKTIKDKTLLKKLFSDIAPAYKDREGGYTRILKLGERKGDNAPTSIIELTGRGGLVAARIAKKEKTADDAALATDKEAAPKKPRAKKVKAVESDASVPETSADEGEAKKPAAKKTRKKAEPKEE
jgi:large subunit ribosomal protein L17